jgi:hypothetical protein
VAISLLSGVIQSPGKRFSLNLAAPEIALLCVLLTCTILVARHIRFRPENPSGAVRSSDKIFVEESQGYNERAFAEFKSQMMQMVEAAIFEAAEQTRSIIEANDKLKELKESPSGAKSVYLKSRSNE